MTNDINSSVGKATHVVTVYDNQRGYFSDLMTLYSDHLYIPAIQEELRAVGIAGFFVYISKT